MIVIRLLLSAGLCAAPALGSAAGARSEPAQPNYQRVDLTDFVTHPDAYQGHLVAVTAEVVSVNANSQALKLYDAGSKALIRVSLAQLKKAQRRALIHDPVRKVSVYGRVWLKGGRLVIDAHRVKAYPTELVARR